MLLLYGLRYFCEDLRVVFGELREYFAVERDIFFLEAGDQRSVGHAVRARRGVDLHVPERPEIAFLFSAMSELVCERMYERFFHACYF